MASFLNDLEDILYSKGIHVLKTVTEELGNELNIHLTMYVLLCVDAAILMAETELHCELDYVNDYSRVWKLNVNIQKSKVIVITRGKPQPKATFTCAQTNLGCILKNSPSFKSNPLHLTETINRITLGYV